MSDLQKKVEAAIIETLTDQYGAGSDLEFCRPIMHGEWLHLEGNLDVAHLASDVIYAVQKDEEYEYSVETSRDGAPVTAVYLPGDWGTRKEAQEQVDRYNDSWSRTGHHYLSAKLVKRRKAGEVRDA